MPRAFANIAFTDSVKAAQERYGSREANSAFELSPDARNELTARETEFIQARDSFYQATVSESGWPYVQHRGGTAGFLKVLNSRTIGYADFYGNAQYISVGNLAVDDRISIILMDYPNRRRLKIWGRAQVVDEGEAPELIAQLEVPRYRAIVERAVIVHVEAFDWNCPQHITPRYTKEEAERIVATRTDVRPTQLEIGDGPLPLSIVAIRQLTPVIRSYELAHRDGENLPSVVAGAHLRIPVQLSGAHLTHRHYSIVRASSDTYEIAVLRGESGSGSSFIHEHFNLGTVVHTDQPTTFFSLDETNAPAVLLAAGIGITPLLAMAEALKAQNRAYRMHYAARSPESMAYRNEIRRDHGPALTTYFSNRGERISFEQVLSSSGDGTVFYACGPMRFIDDLLATADRLGIARGRIRLERFDVSARPDDRPFVVQLRSGTAFTVPSTSTILLEARKHGVHVASDCQVGMCGSCATRVLSGSPDHRDQVLTRQERDQQNLICVCVSRSYSESLVLDL